MAIRCRNHRLLEPALFQVALDNALQIVAQRSVTDNPATRLPQGGAWAPLRHPGLAEGIYCTHCLDAANREPLDVDEIEFTTLGHSAHYFPPAETLDLDEIWPDIERRFGRRIVAHHDMPPRASFRQGLVTPFPEPLMAGLQTCFGRSDVYRHQALAIDAVSSGSDVVVATQTASGKSLCYVLPVLSKLYSDPTSTALYIAPTLALAEDQFGQWLAFSNRKQNYEKRAQSKPEWQFMREVHLGTKDAILIARYAGDTSPAPGMDISQSKLRRRIRASQPRILITTPEMLHSGILGRSTDWSRFLSHLSFVILDEMHSYKGLFGASMVQVMRRLTRQTGLMGARPQFIGCSATIRNPDELGTALMGRVPEVIGPKKDGSPRRRRRFVIVDSARAEEKVLVTARSLIVDMVRRRRLRTISFTRSVNEVDQLYNRVKESLHEQEMGDLVKEFKADLPYQEKITVAQQLKSGRLAAVVTTNALELGLDIGELSVAVLVKFPGSIASLMQQSGRVGRRGEGLIFLLADENPLNQFFVANPAEFFTMKPEVVYLDPDHEVVVADHLVCAAQAVPLDPVVDQRYWGPRLPDLLKALALAGRMVADEQGRYHPADSTFFPSEIGLRNSSFFSVPVLHQREEIAQVASTRAPRILHRSARLQLQDGTYEVSSLHLDWANKTGRAEVRMVNQRDFATSPVLRERSEITDTRMERRTKAFVTNHGAIQLSSEVIGYFQIPQGVHNRDEVRSYHGLGQSAPPAHHVATRATWFSVPPSLLRQPPNDQTTAVLKSMQKALVMAACIFLRCDPSDISGLAVPETGHLFLYDTQAGGSGLAAKVYQHAEEICEAALKLLRDCPFCSQHPESRGCPRCVTDEYGIEEGIDREGAIRLFAEIIEG